jgi:hypothetical protein
MRVRASIRLPAAGLAAALLLGPAAVAGEASPGRILGAALTDSRAYDKLAYLTDRIGHRLSGSPALERAVAWAVEEFERDGIEHVWTEKVLVPHWVRGREAARIVAPVEREMALLALGGSVGTAAGGLTAEVLVVDGFEQLEAAGERVAGKIVLFNKAMEAGFGGEHGYGSVVGLRGPAEPPRPRSWARSEC